MPASKPLPAKSAPTATPSARQHPITIDDLWSLKCLSTGSVSPDGAWTCASVTQPTEVRRGPGKGGTATDLRVSANGKTLVYARSSQQHPPTLLACDADGGNERLIERFNKTLLTGIAMGQAESGQAWLQ